MRRVPPAAGPVKAGSAPWLFHGEGNPLLLLVHLQHPDGDDVAHGAHLGGVLHPAALPELGDVHQPVLVDADVHEHAEVDDVAHRAGELPAWKFKYWASLQAAGPKNLQVRKDQLSGREIPHPTPFAQQMIDEWWRGRFLLYDIGTSTYHDAANILRVFRYAHRRYGAKVYLVDNLMTARFRGNDRDFYRAQSEFVAELASFAHDNNVHVHLVAHPRKTDRISDSDEVAGIGDVTNLADNVYVLEKEEREDRQQDSVLTILKNRFFGERGRSIGLNFERKSKRFYKSGTGNPDKVYGWALSGRQAVVDLPEGGEDPFP